MSARETEPCCTDDVRDAESRSMTLSIPKAVNGTLPAVIPDAIATTASTVIHPIVSHSSLKACRISPSRFAWPATVSV